MSKMIDLTGKPFGILTVLKYDRSENGVVWWLCECGCGIIKSIRGVQLKRGKTISCGCERKKQLSARFWKGIGDLSMSYFCRLKASAKARKIDVKISIGDAWKQYVKQDGACALSGIKLVLSKSYATESNNREVTTTASLDRIDSSKGYIKGNIQWIHKELQRLKWDKSIDSFYESCKIAETALKYRSSYEHEEKR